MTLCHLTNVCFLQKIGIDKVLWFFLGNFACVVAFLVSVLSSDELEFLNRD